MYLLFPQKVSSVQKLFIIALLVLLVGCGKGTTSNPTPVTGGKTPLNYSGILAIDADGLHIQSLTGIECPPSSSLWLISPNRLVLATSRVTYDVGELQQIVKYLDAFYHTDETTYSINKISMPLPASLRWVVGGYNVGWNVDLSKMAYHVDGEETGCAADMEITNIGNTTIQIPQAGVRLTQPPQQNNYQYRLIDTCTIISLAECECHGCGSSPAHCQVYGAGIQLGMGQKGSVFADTPTAYPIMNDQGTEIPCGELTLRPGQTTELLMGFYSLPPPSHLIYSIVPELTLVTANGRQVLALPQLGNSIAFINQSQLSCYGLQGHTFVLEKSGQPDQHCL